MRLSKDGIKDGVIDHPPSCDFRPDVDLAARMCPQDRNADDCFTKRQLQTIKDLYRGPYDSKGARIMKGMDFGSEHDWNRTIFPHRGNNLLPAKLVYGADHFNFLFYEKPPGVPLPNPTDLNQKPDKNSTPPEFAWWEFKLPTAGRITNAKCAPIPSVLSTPAPPAARTIPQTGSSRILFADDAPPAATAPHTGLVRAIGRWDLVALGINVVVGAGIFGLPSRVYGYAGAASLAAYGICALAVSLVALCLAEVGSRFAVTGGPYLYARTAFGPAVGFQVGWMLWLARVAAYAANSNLLAEYMSYFWSPANAGPARAIVITTVILFLTIINLIGVRDAAVASNIFAAGKLIPLAIFIVVGLFFIDPDRFSGVQFPGYSAFSSSALLIVYAFSGFESITVPSGETRDPQRDISFALLVTIGVVTVFYIAIQAVSIGTLPELASSTRPLADAAQRFWGGAGGTLISLGAIISISGNLNAQTLINPRILFAMAEQRHLPSVLSSIHQRFGTPHVSILFTSAVTLALALSGEFVQLVTLSVIGRLLTYSSVCVALPVLRRKTTVSAPKVRIRFGPLVSATSLLLCAWLLSNSSWREARDASIAGAIGFITYAGWRMPQKPSRASLRP